jgi:predicted RNA binding protein YcfA (HicA-like mRNA interferase family)
MATLHNLKPEKVIKAFERAGWINKGQRRSYKERPIKVVIARSEATWQSREIASLRSQ